MLALENPFASFGVTQWSTLISYAIAFLIAAWVLKKFAFAPVLKMLDERRERIQEGEDMRIEAQRRLEHSEESAKEILAEANAKAQVLVEEAKVSAEEYQQKQKVQAQEVANDLLRQARVLSEAEAQKEKNAVEAEFLELLAKATAEVSGKVLTEQDRRLLNDQVISKL